MGVEWMNVLFDLRALNHTVESLCKIDKQKYVKFNPDTNTFHEPSYYQRSDHPDKVVKALEDTVRKITSIESKVREIFSNMRSWGQEKFKTEMGLLDQHITNSLKIGLYNIKELYKDERINRIWTDLKSFQDSDEHKSDLGMIKKPMFADFRSHASDLRAIEDFSREEQELDAEIETWIDQTEFYSKICSNKQKLGMVADSEDENQELFDEISLLPLDLSASETAASRTSDFEKFLNYDIDRRLRSLNKWFDLLCKKNKNNFNKDAEYFLTLAKIEKSIKIFKQIFEVLDQQSPQPIPLDGRQGHRVHRDLHASDERIGPAPSPLHSISKTNLFSMQAALLVYSVIQTLKETDLDTQVKACEILEDGINSLELLHDIRIPQNLIGISIPPALWPTYLKHKNIESTINGESIITAYRHYQPFNRPNSTWTPFSLSQWDENHLAIQKGSLSSPAKDDNDFGLRHFWSKDLCSTSSVPKTLHEMTQLATFVDRKKQDGQPFPFCLVQLDSFASTWIYNFTTPQNPIVVAAKLLKESAYGTTPLLNFELLAQPIGKDYGANTKHNLLGLARIARALFRMIHVNIEPLQEAIDLHTNNPQDSVFEELLRNRLKDSLELMLRLQQAGEEGEELDITLCLKMLMKIHEGKFSSPLGDLEGILFLLNTCRIPVHLFDTNGVDRSGFARALWESLNDMRELGYSSVELFNMIDSLNTERDKLCSVLFETAKECSGCRDLTLLNDHKQTNNFSERLFKKINALADTNERKMTLLMAQYFTKVTHHLFTDSQAIAFLGTGLFGLKFNHDVASFINPIKSKSANPWLAYRLMPCIGTHDGKVIQILDGAQYLYFTPAGIALTHGLSQKRESTYKYNSKSE